MARYVRASCARDHLPEKLFVVHQFTEGMVTDKPAVVTPPGLAVTFNVDGFGTPPAKVSKYRSFTRQRGRFHDGFKLFYSEDTGPHDAAVGPPPAPAAGPRRLRVGERRSSSA